jgi:lysophospholipase L1-like esterase
MERQGDMLKICAFLLIIVLFASLARPLLSAEEIIIFLGDSLVSRCNWAKLFNDERIMEQPIFANTCADILAGLDRVTDLRPAKVFIMVGSNDLASGMTIDEVALSYRNIVERILKDSPHTKIYIQGIIPVNTSRAFFLDKKSNNVLIDMNSKLRGIAGDLKVNYVDLWPHFIKNGQLDMKYAWFDGLHLNNRGYEKWKVAIIDLVKK